MPRYKKLSSNVPTLHFRCVFAGFPAVTVHESLNFCTHVGIGLITSGNPHRFSLMGAIKDSEGGMNRTFVMMIAARCEVTICNLAFFLYFYRLELKMMWL